MVRERGADKEEKLKMFEIRCRGEHLIQNVWRQLMKNYTKLSLCCWNKFFVSFLSPSFVERRASHIIFYTGILVVKSSGWQART